MANLMIFGFYHRIIFYLGSPKKREVRNKFGIHRNGWRVRNLSKFAECGYWPRQTCTVFIFSHDNDGVGVWPCLGLRRAKRN